MKNLLKLILIFFISFDSDASFIESDNDLKDVIKNLKYRNVGRLEEVELLQYMV